MRHSYSDITELTDISPKWYDENGVPRYCDFHPDRLANIYANEAALVYIECQACRTGFKVTISELNQTDIAWNKTLGNKVSFLSDLISNSTLHYGDPPNTDCCAAGSSMNSIPVSVLEYWVRPYFKEAIPGEPTRRHPSSKNWTRDQSFEVPIDKNW